MREKSPHLPAIQQTNKPRNNRIKQNIKNQFRDQKTVNLKKHGNKQSNLLATYTGQKTKIKNTLKNRQKNNGIFSC